MKPYYQDKYATIYLGDCLELLPEMPKVDLVFADPPFGVGENGKMGIRQLRYGNNGSSAEGDKFEQFCLSWFALARKQTERLLVTCGTKNIWQYPEALWLMIVSKPSACCFSRLGGFNVYEPLLVYDKPCE